MISNHILKRLDSLEANALLTLETVSALKMELQIEEDNSRPLSQKQVSKLITDRKKRVTK